MSIDAIKGKIKSHKGLARSNRFNILLTPPAGVSIDKDIQFLAESVSIPSRSISTTEITNHKQTTKNPYTFIDEDVSITFLVPNDYSVKRMFDQWLNKVIDTNRYDIGYKDDYDGTVDISQLDGNDIIVYTAKLQNAFPITVSAIDLSNATENDYVRLTVSFAYDKYITI